MIQLKPFCKVSILDGLLTTILFGDILRKLFSLLLWLNKVSPSSLPCFYIKSAVCTGMWAVWSVQSEMCVVECTVFNMQCVECNVQCEISSVLCEKCRVWCVLFLVEFAEYSVQLAKCRNQFRGDILPMCSVHCTVHCVVCVLATFKHPLLSSW